MVTLSVHTVTGAPQIIWPGWEPSRRFPSMEAWGDNVIKAQVAYLPLFHKMTWADAPPRTGTAYAAQQLHDFAVRLSDIMSYK